MTDGKRPFPRCRKIKRRGFPWEELPKRFGIVPVEDSPLRKLIEELPFDAKDKQVVKN